MALGRRFAELTGLNISDIIHNVVEAVTERAAYSLEDSQHAPKKGNRDTHPGVCQVSSLLSLSLITCSNPLFPSHKPFSTPNKQD